MLRKLVLDSARYNTACPYAHESQNVWEGMASRTRRARICDVISRAHFCLGYERLENRFLLAGVTFQPQDILTSQMSPSAVYSTDVDGDGDADVLTASQDRIAWYANVDSKGTFGKQQAIATRAGVRSLYAADMDGDGDMDVLSGSFTEIVWYENTDGQGNFKSRQEFTLIGAFGANSVHAADVDGDGDMDLLSAIAACCGRSSSQIVWYENTDGQGNLGAQQVITSATLGASSVHAADVDGDGDTDILSAEKTGGKIAWYENTDGNGVIWGPAGDYDSVSGRCHASVYAADVDGDGDVDVLSALYGDDKIAWYENTDGKGAFGAPASDYDSSGRAWAVYAADLDGDGDMDVLSASTFA